MKRTAKKLLSLALALTLAWSLLPVPASAGFETQAAEAGLVDSIALSIDAPAAGKPLDYTMTLPEDAAFQAREIGEMTLNGVLWIDLTNLPNLELEPDPGNMAEEGHQYKVELYLSAGEGRVFSDSAVATVNGRHAEINADGDIALVSYVFPAAAAQAAPTFVDVPEGAFYEAPVQWAVENGVTNGTDEEHFSPNDVCTRAQVVTFLWRAKGEPAPGSETDPFTDVQAAAYYCNAVLWAVENSITTGLTDTSFGPDADCTRAQAVTFLWRAEGKPAPQSRADPFVDVKDAEYCYDAVLWAVENSITTGTDATHFSPGAVCTRGEIVTFLYRDMGP